MRRFIRYVSAPLVICLTYMGVAAQVHAVENTNGEVSEITASNVLNRMCEPSAPETALRIEWTESYTIPAGSRPKRLPLVDLAADRKCRLLIYKGRFRWERQGSEWGVDEGELVQRESMVVYDGEVGRSLYGGEQYGDSPAGFVRKEFDAITEVTLFPVYWSFLGIDKRHQGVPDSKLRIQAMSDPQYGKSFQIVEKSFFPGAVESWLVSARDMTPMKYLLSKQSRVQISIELGYSHSSTSSIELKRRIPSDWKLQLYDDLGNLTDAITAVVTSCRIEDAPAIEEFRIQFPPGSVVLDYRTNTRLRVLSDGTTTLFKDEALSPSVNQNSNRTRLMVVLVSTVLFVGCLGWSVWRRFR